MTSALPLAHGLGGVRDLPVPLWLFYYGAAVVLLMSFIALGALWRRPLLEKHADGRPLSESLARVVLSSAVRVVLGAIGFFLFVAVFLSALLGDRSPAVNLAPTFVYVIFWLGVVPLVVLFGNVWSWLNPWRAAADAWVWISERLGFEVQSFSAYPERLGRWPAAVLLFAFAALELAYVDSANPRTLAIAILIYSYVTWFGMALYGRRAWLENGEAFNVYFGFLSRMAPFDIRERDGARNVVVRWPLSGLSVRDPRPGTLAFVAVMLGSVGFDGFSRTALWQDLRQDLLAGRSPGAAADLLQTGMDLAGLAGCVVLVALAYLAAMAAARLAVEERRSLADDFLLSLVPIALAYVVAHYFSYFVLQGQFVIRLASDPLGNGWDLFGTADYAPRLAFLSPNVTWYVQVVALAVGHIFGLMLAHDRAVGLFRSSRLALRTQYAMLALMVLYTVGGLWVLSQE